ncbi:hypothetical protein MRB53_040854 [Persea americana]|nr:hypothetical protein MRB53_040854 [Persea americana]
MRCAQRRVFGHHACGGYRIARDGGSCLHIAAGGTASAQYLALAIINDAILSFRAHACDSISPCCRDDEDDEAAESPPYQPL